MKTVESEGSYEFGPFRLQPGQRLLHRDGVVVPLLPKPFDILVALVRRAGELVDKDTLLATVWPGASVEENSLAKAVSDVRKALGDGPKDSRYVVTVPKGGYRFEAAVTRQPGPARPPAVAVLPFTNVTADADCEHLTIGLADALITRLTGIRSIVVRPTGSILAYAAAPRDPLRAAQDLNAEFLVDGSIRRLGDRVRISVQLVSAASGGALWGHSFDERMADIFAVEDSVAARVADALALQLPADERQSLSTPPTRDAEAYDLYLRGRYFWSRRSPDSCYKAIACFEQALARDSRYTQAYAGLADAWMMLGLQPAVMRGERPTSTVPHAKAAITKALALDDRVAEVHASLGQISYLYDWDWQAADRAFARALSLNPHYVHTWHWQAMSLVFRRRDAEARAAMTEALRLDPLSVMFNANYGRLLYHARHYDEALVQLRKTVELDPDAAVVRLRLGVVYEAIGAWTEAIAELTKARDLSGGSPLAIGSLAHALARAGRLDAARGLLLELRSASLTTYVSAASLAEVHVGFGDHEAAIDCLEQGLIERANGMVTVAANPRYDVLRGHPRFDRIVREVGLDRPV